MKTTPWTLRKNVAAVATADQIAEMNAAIPRIQAEILALPTEAAAYTLRGVYLDMARDSIAMKRWRVWLLDLLAERIRELRSPSVAPDVAPRTGFAAQIASLRAPAAIPESIPVELPPISEKSKARAKAKKLAAMAEAAKEVRAEPAATPPPSPAESIRASGRIARAKLKAKKEEAATDVLVAVAREAGISKAPTPPDEPTPPEGPKGGKKPSSKKKVAEAKAAVAAAEAKLNEVLAALVHLQAS